MSCQVKMFTRGRNVDRAIYRQTVSRFHLICITHSCTLKRQVLKKKNSFGWYVYLVPPLLGGYGSYGHFNCLPSKMALVKRPRDVGALWRHMLLPLFDHICLFVCLFVCLFCNCCSCNVLQLLTSWIPADILTCFNSPKRSKVWERTENVKFGKSVKADRPPSRLPTNSL